VSFAERASPTGSFLGTYEVLRRLATGGMADVFLARQTIGGRSDRLVVIKSILSGLADRPEFVTMFLEEAHVAAQLQHPNIVQILDVSLLGQRPCIIMEYLNGVDAAWIYRRLGQRGEPLSPIATAALAVGAAYGLGYAHRKAALDGTPLKIVHRDVSPHNVFVTREGLVKILDFGIARTSQQIHTTQAGVLKGKIPYMAPEQMASQPIDGRADLFGLGVVMWELVTGRRLFRRETEVQSMQAVLFEPIPKPSEVRPSIPAELDRIIVRALERTVDRRHESGEALARELERFLQREQDDSPAVILTRLLEGMASPGELDPPLEPVSVVGAPGLERHSDHPVPEITPSRERWVEPSITFVPTGTRRLWVAAVLLVLVAGGLAWAFGRSGSSRPERNAPARAEEPDTLTELPAPPTAGSVVDQAAPPRPDPAAAGPRATSKVRQKIARPPTPPATSAPVPPPPVASPPTASSAPDREPAVRHAPPPSPPPPPRHAEPSGTGVSLDSEYR